MKCPDCGAAMSGAPLGPSGETNQSYRCLRCGGFWINGWLVNSLKSSDLERWPGVENDGSWVALGTDECPNDGTKIIKYAGDQVPPGVEVKRCEKCGWWWFPTNNLFKFKPAQEAKISYFRLWGKMGDMSMLLLPVMAVVVLMVGTVASVQLVRQRQQTDVSATALVGNVDVVNIGGGQAVVTFRSQVEQTPVVLYRRAGEQNWMKVEGQIENGVGSATVLGLEKGVSYRFVVEVSGTRSEEVPFSY